MQTRHSSGPTACYLVQNQVQYFRYTSGKSPANIVFVMHLETFLSTCSHVCFLRDDSRPVTAMQWMGRENNLLCIFCLRPILSNQCWQRQYHWKDPRGKQIPKSVIENPRPVCASLQKADLKFSFAKCLRKKMSDGKVVANNVKSAMCHSAAINLSENSTTVVFHSRQLGVTTL